MSATTSGGWGWSSLPGRARMGIVAGGMVAAVGGAVWWGWHGGVKPLPTSQTEGRWTAGFSLPEKAAPPQETAPPQTPAASDEKPHVELPPAVMSVWTDAKGIQEAIQAAADRRKAAADRRQQLQQQAASGGGGTTLDGDTLTPGNSEYAQRMHGTKFADTRPVPGHLNPLYTIRKGYRIPCLPDQPLSGGMVGPISCTTTQAVRSMDRLGANILLPVGTVINGTVEQGLTVAGQQRLFIAWQDAQSPNHPQPIPLEAPSADEMGQPGVPGDVQTHFWKKLGTLAAVTVLNMGGSAVSSALQSGNNNNTLNFGQPLNSTASLAERAFGAGLSQADSLYRGPAYPILVVTTHNIDLSNFFEDVPVRR